MHKQPIDAKILVRLELEKRQSELITQIATNQALLKVLRKNRWLGMLLARYEAEGNRLDAEYNSVCFNLFRNNPMINPHVQTTQPRLLRMIRLTIQGQLA
jgi:hypothetical protein